MLFELKGVPFPISVNQLYAGKARRYKSDKAKEYELDMDFWFLTNKSRLDKAKTICRPYKFESYKFISLTLDYVVPYETLYTKADKLKTIDVTNYVKSLLDQLSSLLDIDDSHIFLDRVEFVIGDKKCVNIIAKETLIRGLNGKKESNEKKG